LKVGCRRHAGVARQNAEVDRAVPSNAGSMRRALVGAVQLGPAVVTMGPMVRVELERVGALELLGMTLAHLNDAEARGEMSSRVPLLMTIRDKLALALREES
jgi:hypothetical protein